MWVNNHKEKLSEYGKKYYKDHKEHINKLQLDRYYKLKENPNFLKERNEYIKANKKKNRQKVLNYYGGKCECCGESRFEFLAIDHINGGGNKERKETRNYTIYQYLSKNNYPKGYRVLCHNCNCSFGYYKYCPHKT